MNDFSSINPQPQSNLKRSFNGCWTCRVRRKKCDEKRPRCDTCAALHITCNYDSEKPEWMDGGSRQQEKAEEIKREVKENAHRRTSERLGTIGSSTSGSGALPRSGSTTEECRERVAVSSTLGEFAGPVPVEYYSAWQRGVDAQLTGNGVNGSKVFGQSDSILLLFYLEHVLPFMFPFYQPSLLTGGKAWILQLLISSPVVRQATLAQTSFFFSLLRGSVSHEAVWSRLLEQSKDAFEVLRQALDAIHTTDVRDHLPGSVRTLMSIMQVLRFEVAVSSFGNCQAHLKAAVTLFDQILESPPGMTNAQPRERFGTVMNALGPSPWFVPGHNADVPSAEQAALHFSTTLLLCDDIIASICMQEESKLYKYHRDLLEPVGDDQPLIDFESVTGCQNWTMIAMGEVAALDVWKKQCREAGRLDVTELVRRASALKAAMDDKVQNPPTRPLFHSFDDSPLSVFTAEHYRNSGPTTAHRALATQVWAHAAFLYLFVVVSGWQPAHDEVRNHVGKILEYLSDRTLPASMLRALAWPFCVAGCLAESAQYAHFQHLVNSLQPRSIFMTMRRALDVMEFTWRNASPEDVATRDISTCFKKLCHDLILLV